MKKVLTVIAVLAIVAGFSSTAYAVPKTNGWDVLNTFLTGKGLKPNCTTINGSDPLRTAIQIEAMHGRDISITTNPNGDVVTSGTSI